MKPAQTGVEVQEPGHPILTLFLVAGIMAALVGLESRNHAHFAPVELPGVLATLRNWSPPLRWLQLAYVGGNVMLFLPWALTGFRENFGAVHRTLFGFTLQVLLGVSTPPQWLPCLQVANLFFIALAIGRFVAPAWRAGLLVGVALLAINSILILQHDLAEALLGVGLGWATSWIAFSRRLNFLDTPNPFSTVRNKLKHLRNLWTANRREYWEGAYAAGHWDFLESQPQRPRHYTIAGIVRDRFPHGADLLDVGCGQGVLYPLLRGNVRSYVGVDLSRAAVDRCLRRFGAETSCSFHAVGFDDYHADQRFDAVVLNEILYYFPLDEIPRVLDSCTALLKDEGSVLVVSLCRNYKARLVARHIDRLVAPEQSIRIRNMLTGSHWTVSIYRPLSRAIRGEVGAGTKRATLGRTVNQECGGCRS